MILFSIQLIRFAVTVVGTNTADYTFQIIVPIHKILTVIITLVISTPYLFTETPEPLHFRPALSTEGGISQGESNRIDDIGM